MSAVIVTISVITTDTRVVRTRKSDNSREKVIMTIIMMMTE